jgi:3-methyl-2-oxobutanoate hydroxymethyltransferase
VPNEASQAVVAAVNVPVIGCGAGPACDAHVVVIHDMLGMGARRPPRFVPVLDNFGERMENAMRRWVVAIEEGAYPAPEHAYQLKKQPADSTTTP